MCEGRLDTSKGFEGQFGFFPSPFCGRHNPFSKADARGCEAILDVLGKFCRESGQKISLDKSRIYFSPNVRNEVKEEIRERLGIRETNNIGKYLGFPFKHRGVPRNPITSLWKGL